MGFGDLDIICDRVPVPLCSLVGPYSSSAAGLEAAGIMAKCYSRNVSVANTIIFQTGNAFISIGTLAMMVIIIFNVRSKYTAVGRREILQFFNIYALLTIFSLLVDTGVVPPASKPYPYFVAVQSGLVSAACWCLMLNGFVGFQLYEDGTNRSIWTLRLITVGSFALTFVISIFTFKSWGSLSPKDTTALFVVLYILNLVAVVIYAISQIILVLFTLQDLWPLGDIALGIFFFVAGQVLLNVFSSTLCEHMKHYVDGLMFATFCNILTVMMIYKYWDSITREDLEFSVGANVVVPVQRAVPWDGKEYYDEDQSNIYQNEGSGYTGSFYALRDTGSAYQLARDE
ncbi:chitin synthase III catalytic subunit [Myxozyma melibiosi]|uniref:Chitin synthase export chaperone n=1 Tax=Myxozyma melibiosi TaxID=54550 RepID=A0ABR1F0X3_9ASCO